MSLPSLTIGMAVFDDFDGVYFSITSAMIHHDAVARGIEFVVVDNNPASKQGEATKSWVKGRVPKSKYVAYTKANGTAQPRNQVFAEATSDVVLCIDPHVLLQPDAIDSILKHYEAQGPDCKDLVTGPMLMDRGAVAGMFQRPEWGKGALGKWSMNPASKNRRGGHRHFAEPEVWEMEPFEIWQQGMGLFSMRRDNWVKFHPAFQGFGGCETYVMDKVRQDGGQVICHPRLGWTHRFMRPMGVPYHPRNRDKLRNYLIGFQALGRSLDEVLEAFGVSEEDALKLIANRKHHVRIVIPKKGAAATKTPTKPDAKPVRSHDPRIGPVRGRGARGARAQKKTVESINYTSIVIGHPNYGGTKMRGNHVAKLLNSKVAAPDKLGGIQPRDIIYYIKDGGCPAMIRRKAKKRLIWDPLDCFYGRSLRTGPARYWLAKYGELKFDDILATSPACYEVMRNSLPKEVRVHLVPHQCDPRVSSDWRDPDGPVVYTGLGAFIETKLAVIKQACASIGKKFVSSPNQNSLKGASLALALRCAPYNTDINKLCKPQIKIENAAAAALPMVTTSDPATISQRPELSEYDVSSGFTASQLADSMSRALAGPPLANPYTDSDFIAAISEILGIR